MALWKPDPSFYPSARMAMQAPPERHAYVAALNYGRNDQPDGIRVVDLDPHSPSYGEVVNALDLPHLDDELHHFGWNACSSALCPYAPHPHLERRYLVVPGVRSSRLYIIDTKPDPRRPRIARVIEPEEVMAKSGYSRPHTVHCGPDAIYVSAMGSANGDDGPGGIFLLDHFSFDVIGPWEIERGDQELAYDFWWHLAEDTLVSSEWAKPRQFEDGLVPEDLLGQKYGHRIHFWDLRKRKLSQTIDLGAQHQMVLELRPAHDPRKTYGFAGVVISTEDLSASIWLWHRKDGEWRMEKVITIPAEPADPDDLPPALKDFSAVPPLVSDIDLSLDDRFLYVSCWGTGELHQYDVSDPFNPKLAGKVVIGGIVNKAPHPRSADPLLGGPQMVEISRDGRRVYFTNSLYSTWDDQFYPDRMGGWMVKVDVDPDGGIQLDPDFFVDFGETRVHQIRLEGGDSSTDSFCYPS
ncbi:selenium-binding family protein [Microbulbifer yueqingensis]|uniref:Selenium-binding protein 1 n=1 Tax=Microbulbifer yueqingensis TaxID=658219 RepID=A0A1G8XVJ5_9GAMM|nr:selenium-binding family protein [Microbulbifer yueqingensis]SDJ93915.1 selenium-binding protein 1 [Microbulbifer yueqingensis]